MILFIDLRSEYWFLQRQFVWVMPAFALFLGWAWESCALYFWKASKIFVARKK